MFLKTEAQEASAGRFLGSVLTLLRPPLPLLPPTHTHTQTPPQLYGKHPLAGVSAPQTLYCVQYRQTHTCIFI